MCSRDRRGVRPVRGDLEDTRLGEETAAWAVLGEGYLLNLESVDSGNPVVLRESPVHEGEIRIDQFADATIVPDQLGEEAPRLLEHGLTQDVVVFRIERLIRRGRIDFLEFEPLVEEVVDEPLCLLVVEKAIRF